MARYKPVTRLITIHIHKAKHDLYLIDVTPDSAEAIEGDVIRWEVQGAPAGVVVGVGNFTRLDAPAGVRVSGAKCTVQKPKSVAVARLKRHSTNIAFQTRPGDVGYYKYDILFDGTSVLDPDIEIKGRPGY